LAKLKLSDKKLITEWMENHGVDMNEAPKYYEYIRKNRIKFRFEESTESDRDKAYNDFVKFLCGRCHDNMKV
jgi:hypothetical protein